PAHALIVAQAELHLALEHPEDLLVRVLVGCRVGAGLHRPPDDHLLVADENAARDLVGNFLLRKVLERVIAVHVTHANTSSLSARLDGRGPSPATACGAHYRGRRGAHTFNRHSRSLSSAGEPC